MPGRSARSCSRCGQRRVQHHRLLTGWQAGAETLARPDSFRFHRPSAARGDRKAFPGAGRPGRHAQPCAGVHAAQQPHDLLHERRAKHINTWYLLHDKSWVFPARAISEFSYARPDVAASWVRGIARRAAPFSTALTVSGITGTLTSSYDRSGVSLTLPDGIRAVQDALSKPDSSLSWTW